MIDYIKSAKRLATENDDTLHMYIERVDNGYVLHSRNKFFDSDELRKITDGNIQVKMLNPFHPYESDWFIPAPGSEARKLILESNLYLLFLKILGKTENKA